MKFNDSFNVLIISAIILFSALSFSVDKFPQLIFFMFSVSVLTIIFSKVDNYNNKIYYGVVIIVLAVFSYILAAPLDLDIIESFIFPILGALVLAVVMDNYLEKYAMIRKSLSMIGMDKFQESIDNSNKILESYPEDYGGLLVKAYALRWLKRYQEQLEISDKLLEKRLNKSKKIVALNSKTDALLRLKRYDEAEELVENILKKYPENEAALSHKAYLLSKQGNYLDAIEYYENSLEKMDKLLLKHKKSRLAKIMPLTYGLGEIWVNKGKTHQKLQQYTEALDSFNKALELEPDYEPAKRAKEEHLKLRGK